VLIEKFVQPARHIEVQVFGDRLGNVIHLFERDCSVQRRHQKVVEEAPAPGMTAERRRQMGAAAVAAARAVSYVGAGTVEFIAAEDGAFYFMEMNTRLQVEHPVTEMITGLDLVEWQLRVAAGEALPMRQDELGIRGHAIEARIYAEDPAREFLPSIGRLEYLATPATHDELRIDTGVREGDEITPFYDPMIAKLIVHGDTRDAALARMRAALDEFHVAGVSTNVGFLRRLMHAPSFREARLDTALIERERAQLFAPAVPATRFAWDLAACAWWRSMLPAGTAATPWDDVGSWRLAPGGRRRWKLRHGDQQQDISLWRADRELMVEIDGDAHPVDAVCGDHGLLDAMVAGQPLRAHVHVSGPRLHLFLAGEHHQFEWLDPYLPAAVAADRHGGLVAPMPGRVIAVLVQPGQKVTARTPLLIMEAMKMEHTLTAPADGTVVAVNCETGEQVREGTELLHFE
jgi:3-methylcrotonyl-CoA carboxylase alpha subunit